MYYVETILVCVAHVSRKIKALPLIIRLTRGGRLISTINCDNWRGRPPQPS